MPKFIGTIEEFHKFIGPRIRNKIQSITKRRKKEIGHICQLCNQKSELDAAHLRENDRKTIIERVLKNGTSADSNVLEIDIESVEARILAAHVPIERYFKFLCNACHRKYDSSN